MVYIDNVYGFVSVLNICIGQKLKKGVYPYLEWSVRAGATVHYILIYGAHRHIPFHSYVAVISRHSTTVPWRLATNRQTGRESDGSSDPCVGYMDLITARAPLIFTRPVGS